MNRRHSESEVQRAERLAEIRRQIQTGTYDTPERLALAVDALFDRLALNNRPEIPSWGVLSPYDDD